MKLKVFNILDLINEIGENDLYSILSDFSCPQNPDVEHFLKHNAIDFAQQGKSVSHLVMNAESGDLVGYFTLAIKPITIFGNQISKTMASRIRRISVLDSASNSFTLAAYLIAQLGKNYSIDKTSQITGSELLSLAITSVSRLKHETGGVVQFVECEDNDFLLNFYNNHEFKIFDSRMTEPKGANPRKLYQLIRKID